MLDGCSRWTGDSAESGEYVEVRIGDEFRTG